jgi:hypothetical protein
MSKHQFIPNKYQNTSLYPTNIKTPVYPQQMSKHQFIPNKCQQFKIFVPQNVVNVSRLLRPGKISLNWFFSPIPVLFYFHLNISRRTWTVKFKNQNDQQSLAFGYSSLNESKNPSANRSVNPCLSSSWKPGVLFLLVLGFFKSVK